MTEQHQAVTTLSDRIDSLTDAIRAERFWRGVLALLVTIIFAAGVLLGVFLVSVSRQNRDNGRILVECTTPSRPDDVHECYERNQKATADAITQIQQNTVDAFVTVVMCGQQHRGEALRACVDEALGGPGA